jgi:hypothetical protein
MTGQTCELGYHFPVAAAATGKGFYHEFLCAELQVAQGADVAVLFGFSYHNCGGTLQRQHLHCPWTLCLH